jgi:hypothetical protein
VAAAHGEFADAPGGGYFIEALLRSGFSPNGLGGDSAVFWRTSSSAACSSMSGEGATTALGAIMPDACASVAGASPPNCSDQFAIISLAALPYDCQLDVAATPRQNAIISERKSNSPAASSRA